MTNTVILIGKINEDIRIIDENKCIINMAVGRNYKNDKGEYQIDYINVILNGTLKENAIKYLQKGNTIGIHGMIESYEDNSIAIIANKLTFLSSKSKEINEEVQNEKDNISE